MDTLSTQAELAEARRIVSKLAAIRDRLTVQDRRFLESWQIALARHGDALPVGPLRLALLRRVHAGYFPHCGANATIDVLEIGKDF